MAKDKKSKKRDGAGGAAVPAAGMARVRALYGAGDVAAARAAAAQVAADASASADEKAAAETLLKFATPDARALHVGLLALGLALFVIGVFVIG